MSTRQDGASQESSPAGVAQCSCFEEFHTNNGTEEVLECSHKTSRHNKIVDTGGMERVGPWPLKRNGSSQTTVVGCEGLVSGIDRESKDKSGQSKSEFSRLMELLDEQYDFVKRLMESEPALVEEAHNQWRKANEAVNGFFGEGRQEEREGDINTAGTAGYRNSEDIERHADDTEHAFGSCCQQCFRILERRKIRARVCTLIVGLCGIIIITSPALFAQLLSKDGKLAVYDVRVASRRTKTLLFGLLLLPTTAVSMLGAMAMATLDRTRVEGRRHITKVDSRFWKIIGMHLWCWMSLLLLGLAVLQQYITVVSP